MVEQAVEQMFSRYLLRPHVLAKIIAATEAYGGPKDFSQQRQEIERLMAKRGKLIDLHTSERIALKNLMSGRNP